MLTQSKLTREPTREELLTLLLMGDDTEEAPWMAMNDAQVDTASALRTVLRAYAHRHSLGWYVATMLPIIYTLPPAEETRMVSPDLYVAFVPERRRSSYVVAEEGSFPPFVLEVISPDSVARHTGSKLLLYEVLGVQEYLLFNPSDDVIAPPLRGHRRDHTGRFADWQPNAGGRLYRNVLNISFFIEPDVEGCQLRVETPDEGLLLTFEEMQAEFERLRAEVRRTQES